MKPPERWEPAQRNVRCAGSCFVQPQNGFTLAEMLVVVLIIAILSAVIMPELKSTEPMRVDYAVSEVLSALSYARSKSQSSTDPYGVRFYVTTEELKVFRMTGGIGNYVETYDVLHPHDKRPYTASMQAPDSGTAPDLKNVVFDFEGNVEQAIAFDSQGAPRRPHRDFNKVLTTGSLEIAVGNHSATVHVSPIGRIWTQQP